MRCKNDWCGQVMSPVPAPGGKIRWGCPGCGYEVVKDRGPDVGAEPQAQAEPQAPGGSPQGSTSRPTAAIPAGGAR